MKAGRVSNKALPGYRYEVIPPMFGEFERRVIYDPAGVEVGAIVYVHRRRSDGASEYGWRPWDCRRRGLSSQVEAVRRLIGQVSS